MNQPPLNPDAIRELTEAIRLTVEYVGTGMLPAIPGWSWYDAMVKYAPNDAEVLRAMDPLPEPAAALPEVTSVPGVYDLGSPEPAGVDHVVECDEFGEPYERGDSANDPTWSKTTDGTRWKGYKDGKEYRTWADLVRRYGPLTEYRPEVKP